MAGGEGTRLRPLTSNAPKPMLPLVNRPMMEHIVDLLRSHGIDDIVVTVAFMPNAIRNYFGDGSEFGVRMVYATEESPLGTAGSVRNAMDELDDTFLVISGDVLTDIDLTALVAEHREREALATIGLVRVENPLEYGIVISNEDGSIERFLEKPTWGQVFSDTINSGVYVLEPRMFDWIAPGQPVDFSSDVFPALLEAGEGVFGSVAEGYWEDVGTLSAYVRAHKDILDGKVRVDIPGFELADGVFVGEGAEINPGAHLRGPCPCRDVPGGHLVAEVADRRRRRADPGQAGVDHGLREVGVLGQEPVPRVDGVGAAALGHVEELVHHEVGVRRRAAAEGVGLVGGLDVQGIPVRVGVDGDRRDARVPARPGNPDGDLTAVGDQDLLHAAHPSLGSPARGNGLLPSSSYGGPRGGCAAPSGQLPEVGPADAELPQQRPESGQRQPDHVRVVAVDAIDERPPEPVDRARAGHRQGFAGGDVGLQLDRVGPPEADGRRDRRLSGPPRGDVHQGVAGDQDPGRRRHGGPSGPDLLGPPGLAEQLAGEVEHRVGPDDQHPPSVQRGAAGGLLGAHLLGHVECLGPGQRLGQAVRIGDHSGVLVLPAGDQAVLVDGAGTDDRGHPGVAQQHRACR